MQIADVPSPILSVQDAVEAFSAAIGPGLADEKDAGRLDRKSSGPWRTACR